LTRVKARAARVT